MVQLKSFLRCDQTCVSYKPTKTFSFHEQTLSFFKIDKASSWAESTGTVIITRSSLYPESDIHKNKKEMYDYLGSMKFRYLNHTRKTSIIDSQHKHIYLDNKLQISTTIKNNYSIDTKQIIRFINENIKRRRSIMLGSYLQYSILLQWRKHEPLAIPTSLTSHDLMLVRKG